MNQALNIDPEGKRRRSSEPFESCYRVPKTCVFADKTSSAGVCLRTLKT